MAFRKAILKPGEVLRVGRDETMGLALPHDTQLAGIHFELAWDGEKCRLRNLDAPSGTLLDGMPIQEEVVPHGGWIRAGGTDFLAHIERHTALAPTESSSQALQDSERPHVLKVLSEQTSLYAVLDAARSEQLLPLLQESVDEHRSLYEGPQGAALAEVAPYIVQLPRGSRLLELLVQNGWGEGWGIYLTSEASFIETRRHLRKFLMVELDGLDGNFYFRFYDPRVLHGFLPTCAAQQRAEFFGPITRFFYEETERLHLLVAKRDGFIGPVCSAS
jgi:hypothetical protein